MRKITLFILLVIGMMTVKAQFANPAGYTGNGTEDFPFQIWDAEDLDNLRQYVGTDYEFAYFEIKDNIDLASYIQINYPDEGWDPIGTCYFYRRNPVENMTTPFMGNIQGNGKVISSFWINYPQGVIDDLHKCLGLFGYLRKATIENLGIQLDPIRGITGNSNIGVIAGYSIMTIYNNCHTANGTIRGCTWLGGLIGNTFIFETAPHNNIITYCHSNVNIDAVKMGGGLIGDCREDTIRYSYAEGNVSVTDEDAGGLTGVFAASYASNCYARGDVRGGSDVGGLVGEYNSVSHVNTCYSTGTVNGSYKGAFFGYVTYQSHYDVVSCYYDYTKSSIAGTAGGNKSGITGKTTSQMMQQSTYVGWDFENIWSIDEGNNYPVLQFPQTTCFAGGDGTEENPYLIANAQQLDCFIDHAQEEGNEGMHYRITHDINVSQHINDNYPLTGWRGNELQEFNGYLHGGGHIISGIWVYYTNSQTVGGLFAGIGADGLVDSLGIVIENKGIIGLDEVGGFVGRNNGEIFSCFVMGGNVQSSNAASGLGGFVGSCDRGYITNCYSTTIVMSMGSIPGYVGGLVGYNNRGRIEGCYSAGSIVTPFHTAGALVGYNYNTTNNNISYNYFDTERTMRSNAIGVDNKTNNRNYGLTTAQMKDINELDEFDFEETWKLLPGCYPILQWQDGAIAPFSIGIINLEENILQLINDREATIENNVYPNPTIGVVTIETEIETPDVQVYDANGNIIISTTEKTVDLSSYPTGTYIFNINGEVKKVFKK